MILALLLAVQAALPTEKQAEDAVRAMRAEFARADNSGKIAAVHLAVVVLHERVLRSVGELFQSEPDEVRIGVAEALGTADHPASVAALVSGLAANERRPAVASAICRALGKLGWQKAAPALEALARRAAVPDVRAFLPEALDALGALGATSSIPPLLEFLHALDDPKRGLPGEKGLRRAAEASLRAITGAEFKDAAEAEAWWKLNSPALLATARKTVWSKKTGERNVLLAAEKPPADVEIVCVRITEPAADAPKPKKKDKKP